MEQLTSFLLHIHCFSYIHMMFLNITAIFQAVKYISIGASQKKIFPPIFSDTVCLAFFHNDGRGNDETWLTKHIRKALNTLLAIL